MIAQNRLVKENCGLAQNQLGARGGRPRKVSPHVALDRAVGVFWRRGFEGTSLMDLSDATGLKRPSLAATFGDKRDLYLAALRQRADRNTAAMKALLSSSGSIEDVLGRVVDAALTQHLAGEDGAQGCFVLSTAVAPARFDAEVAEILRGSIRDIDRLFRERFEQEGMADSGMRGAMASATIHNLAIRARSGEPPAALRTHGQAAAKWLTSKACA